jgi:NAD(P)H-hydrate repair Nnr-like enzyme with NAD(P)H-hydrate dehydratase domain
LLENTLTLLGGVVRAATDGVANLLAGGLLALCEVLVVVQARPGKRGVRTRLNGAGNAVTGSGDVLADLVGGRLLGVRSD